MLDVEKLVNELTIEEKATLLAGHKSWHTNQIERLNIPSIFLTDGPHGLRKKKENSKIMGLGNSELSTCFPAAVTTASSWNENLLYQMGLSIGKECNYYDVNVILGPAINIKRNPLCGRNFEYFSEDPLITGILATKLTQGIEACNVATSIKHFAANNKEKNRYYGNSVVDERALREIYLKGFERVVKEGKCRTIMCSYNKVNGLFASENPQLLNKILRDEWGFTGLVMSDWGAVNNRIESLKAGLDLEMPGDVMYNKHQIIKGYQTGVLKEETLNKAVVNVLNLINSTIEHENNNVDFEEHSNLAKLIAIDSAVLLKNENNILPLSLDKKYLVIGEMFEKMRYQGAGSSLINPYKLIEPKEAFVNNKVNFEYVKGYDLLSFDIDEKAHKEALIRCSNYDTVLFFGGLSEMAESEGCERRNLLLPKNQRLLLEDLLKLGKKIVLVLYGGSPIEIPQYESLAGILNMYLPGQEGGNATFDLLFGKASPSGRLAETWPLKLNDVPFIDDYLESSNDLYKESIFVGYRYYSSFDIPVRFPFGYGLSYAKFKYDNLNVNLVEDKLKIEVCVENISDISASETVEVFISAPKSKIIKPKRELKGFKKVMLKPQERKTVHIEVPLVDLRCYLNGNWVLENGIYQIEICKNASEVIVSQAIFIKGLEKVSYNEKYFEVYNNLNSFNSITDDDFEEICGCKKLVYNFAPPYDLNTPLSKYESFGGKGLYKLIRWVFKLMYKNALKLKNDPDKETKIKNAYFMLSLLESMTLRSMAYASEGVLSHRRALGLLDIANNHFFKGIWKLITPEKYK